MKILLAKYFMHFWHVRHEKVAVLHRKQSIFQSFLCKTSGFRMSVGLRDKWDRKSLISVVELMLCSAKARSNPWIGCFDTRTIIYNFLILPSTDFAGSACLGLVPVFFFTPRTVTRAFRNEIALRQKTECGFSTDWSFGSRIWQGARTLPDCMWLLFLQARSGLPLSNECCVQGEHPARV